MRIKLKHHKRAHLRATSQQSVGESNLDMKGQYRQIIESLSYTETHNVNFPNI